MRFNVIGWNFRKTPVEVRDKLALTPRQQLDLGQQLSRRFKLGGVVILSTCNRTEFYIVNAEQQLEQIIEMLEAHWKLEELHESVYTIQNLDGVRHLFRVASSLESMVLGEPQILGQLKDSFQSFSDTELTGKLLHPLFTRAFSTAKRVRTETTIASNAVSISYAAVELAKHIFEDIKSTLSRLGLVFDTFFNENTLYENGEISNVVETLREKQLIYDKEGATWFAGTKVGREVDRVLIKSTGEPTYRLPDIAYHKDKFLRECETLSFSPNIVPILSTTNFVSYWFK